MKKKGWLRRLEYSIFISFDWGHLTLKLPVFDAILVFAYVESTLLVLDVGLLFALRPKFTPLHFQSCCGLFSSTCLCFLVCFSQNHSLSILHFLLLFISLFVSFEDPSFILEYGWFCCWSCCFIGVVGGLLLVLGGWLLLLVFSFCSCFCECYCFCFLFCYKKHPSCFMHLLM